MSGSFLRGVHSIANLNFNSKCILTKRQVYQEDINLIIIYFLYSFSINKHQIAKCVFKSQKEKQSSYFRVKSQYKYKKFFSLKN